MMKENKTEHSSSPTAQRYGCSEERREPIQEPDQRRQGEQAQDWRRHETIRLVVLCVGLLSVMLSSLLFCLTRNVLPLFMTIVVFSLFYRWLDSYLLKKDQQRDVHRR